MSSIVKILCAKKKKVLIEKIKDLVNIKKKNSGRHNGKDILYVKKIEM